MRLLESWIIAVVAVATSLWLTGAYAADEAHFKTPEEAVTGFMEALKKQDFEAILATTAADRMSKGFDFVAKAEQIKVIAPYYAMPTSDPFFISVNKAIYTGQIAKHIQYFTYSLMIVSPILEGKTDVIADNPMAATDMFEAVQAKRLSELSISKIGIPMPEKLNSERQQRLFSQHAKIFQSDAATERVALLSFDGLDYLIGFSLLRYDDNWLVEDMVSWIAETSVWGTAKRTTPDEFEALIR